MWMAIWWMSEAVPLSLTGVLSARFRPYLLSNINKRKWTALLPLVLFPIFGVSQPDDVAESYFNDLSFLFMGTISLFKTDCNFFFDLHYVMFACAMQRWNLHKRFALKILLIVGTNPAAVLFGILLQHYTAQFSYSLLGFMFCTFFLSWWLSNSATAGSHFQFYCLLSVSHWT